MAVQTPGPCDWPIRAVGDCPDLDALANAAEGDVSKADVEAAAVDYLWRWTGRAFGVCEATIRPVRQDCYGSTYAGASGVPSGGAWFEPVLVGGRWYNLACGLCGDECACTRLYSIRLPGPVQTVERVALDGVELDPAAYRVDNRANLVRDDGGRWPVCQRLDVPVDAEGAFAVTYRFGLPVPLGGQVAAGVLACELAKALSYSADCRLPQRVQTVTREGVTVGMFDTFEGLDEGRTGIWTIDSWVASVTKPAARATVHNPDVRPPARTTYRGAST